MVNMIDRDALTRGTRIGRGGQGTVYPVANRRINQRWDVVYKEYAASVLPDVRVGALTAMTELLTALPAADARWLSEKTAWPAGLVGSAGRVTGFLMRAVPEQFRFDMAGLGASSVTSRRLAAVEFLLNPDAYVAGTGLRVSERDRLLLLADVAATLSRLHSLDITVGDLSPKNLLFSVTPEPACFFIDCDAMRLHAADALPQAETPDWRLPAGEQPGTPQGDAYKFALLAIRMFARDQVATDPAELSRLDPALAALARRSLDGDPLARPAPADWVGPLGTAAEWAATEHATAPAPPTPASTTASRVHRAARGWSRATALAVAAAVILVVGIITTHHASNGGGGGSGYPQPTVTDPLPATTAPPPVPPPSPSPTDAMAGAVIGGCFANDGTEQEPDLQAGTCEAGDFEVVQVLSGTTDPSGCDGVADDDWNVTDNAGDQVLCLSYQDTSSAYHATTSDCVYGAPGNGQTWSTVPCQPGNFNVLARYTGTSDTNECGSGSDVQVTLPVGGYPDLDVLLCLAMDYPLVATVPLNACLSQSGSGSDATFTSVPCDEANEIVSGRISQYDDVSFCGTDGSYSWEPSAYPGLGVTVCLRASN